MTAEQKPAKKFVIREIYTKADFVSLLQGLMDELPDGDELVADLRSNLDWALAKPDHYRFWWIIGEDGCAYPQSLDPNRTINFSMS